MVAVADLVEAYDGTVRWLLLSNWLSNIYNWPRVPNNLEENIMLLQKLKLLRPTRTKLGDQFFVPFCCGHERCHSFLVLCQSG